MSEKTSGIRGSDMCKVNVIFFCFVRCSQLVYCSRVNRTCEFLNQQLISVYKVSVIFFLFVFTFFIPVIAGENILYSSMTKYLYVINLPPISRNLRFFEPIFVSLGGSKNRIPLCMDRVTRLLKLFTQSNQQQIAVKFYGE